jgi:hypothetical protein
VARNESKRDRGFVIDYVTQSVGANNFTFKGNVTYYVTAACTFGGNAPGTTFEAGSTIKFAPASSAKIFINGPIIWTGSAYAPIIMTGKDDSSVGATISGAGTMASTDRYATIALDIDAGTPASDAVLQNLRICNAQTAISITGRSGNSFMHVQIVNCDVGIKPTSTEFKLLNALLVNVGKDLQGANSVTGRLEHVTSDGGTWFNYNNSVSPLFVANSLLVGVANLGTYTPTAVTTLSSSSGVFASVGQGQHYLPITSPYRNAGSASVSIASALRSMTTEAPVLLNTDFIADTILYPSVQRDTDALDLGAHFWPVDYLCSGLNLTNCSLTLTNGASLAMYGNKALIFRQGGKFFCEGTPLSLNHLTHYVTVQEMPVVWGSAFSGFLDVASATLSPYPEIRMRFTDVSFMGSDTNSTTRRVFITGAGTSLLSPLAISHSQFRDVFFTFGNTMLSAAGHTVNLTNNLFQNCYVEFDADVLYYPMTLSAYNNLFRQGIFKLIVSTNTSWTMKDNLFDSDWISNSITGSLTVDYNGYRSGLSAIGSGTHNKTGLAMDYVSGSLGSFYYPASGTGLFTLVNAGSRLASAAGLYHFTTSATTGTKETTTMVDIGYHRVGVDSSGNPIDTDGDGFGPDYLEDRNGNGTFDSGETDWQNSNSGINGTTTLIVFTPLR